jgi:quercetin dioxygenase-like cupin family protein
MRAALPFLYIAALAGVVAGQSSAAKRTKGYLLGPDDGEALQVRNGRMLIKVDPRTGSSRLAMGVQTLVPGSGIGIHMHEAEDEILFLHEGSRSVTVGDETRMAPKGSTVYVPRGVWHGVATSPEEAQVVWVVSPPGLESFFRDVGTRPGDAPKQLTPERLDDIRRKHGYRARPQ